MSRTTGKAISRFEHIEQSILDILETDKFERVFLNGYGAGLRSFIDEPNNPQLLGLLQSYITKSIIEVDTRVAIRSVEVRSNENGDELQVLIHVTDLLNNQQRSIELFIGVFN